MSVFGGLLLKSAIGSGETVIEGFPAKIPKFAGDNFSGKVELGINARNMGWLLVPDITTLKGSLKVSWQIPTPF